MDSFEEKSETVTHLASNPLVVEGTDNRRRLVPYGC